MLHNTHRYPQQGLEGLSWDQPKSDSLITPRTGKAPLISENYLSLDVLYIFI